MIMDLYGCHVNKLFVVDGEDQGELWTRSLGLSKTDWLLAILVRVIRPDRSDRSLASIRPVLDVDQTGASRKVVPPHMKQVYKSKQKEGCRKWISTHR
jgi:hypothetical protein